MGSFSDMASRHVLIEQDEDLCITGCNLNLSTQFHKYDDGSERVTNRHNDTR